MAQKRICGLATHLGIFDKFFYDEKWEPAPIT